MDWFFQQLINGLALGSIYALIALGYTMVYGILRFINFAHSDVLMLGAFAAFFLAPAVAHLFPLPSFAGALLVTALAAGICAGIGILIELLAYRPLRNRPKLTVLITAIGVSLFLEYTCQHRAVFGAATKPFPNLLPQHDFRVAGLAVNSNDLVVPVVTVVLLAALWLIVQKTKIGTAMLVEGLWLLRSPHIRKLFGFRIFLDIPMQLRLRRRLNRDVADRGRSTKSVQDQFRKTVEPMRRQRMRMSSTVSIMKPGMTR